MLFKSLPEARDFYDNKLNDSAKVFLFDRIGWKTTRMSRTVTIDGFIRFFFTAYPDIKDFTVDELNSITSEESYKAFLKSKGIQVNDDFIREEKEYVKKNIEIPNNQNINGYTQRDVKENEYKPGEKPHMIQLAEEYITNPPEPKMNKWLGKIKREDYSQIVESAGDLAKVWAIAPERDGILLSRNH